MKKIITTGYAWRCSNLDLLAPIEEEGALVLFDDNTTQFFPYKIVNGVKTNNLGNYEYATQDELRLFINRRGAVVEGDTVIIFKGRKMVGETKTIDEFFQYNVEGTYGHVYVNYAVFTDGTKCNLQNCKPALPDGINFFDEEEVLKYGTFKGYNILKIGGRL